MVMTTDQDAKNMGVLLWLSTLVLGFIPALILLVLKKGNGFVDDQAKEALNWCITVFLGYVLSAVLALMLLGGLMSFLVTLAHIIICIKAAMTAAKGEAYRAPWALRLMK